MITVNGAICVVYNLVLQGCTIRGQFPMFYHQCTTHKMNAMGQFLFLTPLLCYSIYAYHGPGKTCLLSMHGVGGYFLEKLPSLPAGVQFQGKCVWKFQTVERFQRGLKYASKQNDATVLRDECDFFPRMEGAQNFICPGPAWLSLNFLPAPKQDDSLPHSVRLGKKWEDWFFRTVLKGLPGKI